MRTATIAELHERLDEYLDAVRSGEPVELRDETGRIGQIVPDSKLPAIGSDLEALIAAGVVRGPRTRAPLPSDFFTRPRPRFSTGSVLETLLKEREEGW